MRFYEEKGMIAPVKHPIMDSVILQSVKPFA
ncbi:MULTISPECIES: hypothetical protein [Paenibacillus]